MAQHKTAHKKHAQHNPWKPIALCALAIILIAGITIGLLYAHTNQNGVTHSPVDVSVISDTETFPPVQTTPNDQQHQ